ncbi:MAG: lysine--tRNA ligase [Planctomycetota bacterium]
MTEEKIRAIKLEKIQSMREQGLNPYPERYERSHTLSAAAQLPAGTKSICVAGRMVSRREFGKLVFFDLQDLRGRLQISLQADQVGKDVFKTFGKLADVGDFIGVRGDLYLTKVGQLTLAAAEYTLLGKTLHALPEKYHALADQELKYRRRYLDLIMDEESRRRFTLRSRLISALRTILDRNGFEEVDTPVLQTKPSGALAKPFATHHNALDIPVFLRIAPETYLKRCIVAGYDRVYEVARVFRNEGMDPSHLQDFTMLEYYAAYWNYVDNMAFTERLLRETLEIALGKQVVEIGGTRIDFGVEWPRRSLADLIEEYAGIDVNRTVDAESLRAAVAARGIELEGTSKLGRGALIDQLYKKVCRPNLVQPVFVTSHPIDLSPLARRSDDQAHLADRFQLVVRGWEIVNAYSELVDPIDQRLRLDEQARLNAGGDDEAMLMDEDYLLAMEHGMPPISGWGLGVDRFAALAAGVENLRDVVLFPLMKPESTGIAGEA